MKKLQTISVILLAMLVLLSSTSFMVGMHFCSGKVQNITLFSKAAGCAMEQKMPACHRPAKTPCCEDKIVIHKGNDFKTSINIIYIAAPVSIYITLPFVLSEIIPSISTDPIRYQNYDPPLISYDITLKQQVFLI